MDKLMDALRIAEAALEAAMDAPAGKKHIVPLYVLEKVRAALASTPVVDAHYSAAQLIAEVADLRSALRQVVAATEAEGALGRAIAYARLLVRGA